MTKRTSGPVGTLERKKIDITFLQAGKTTREEVVERLGWMDSGIKEDRLFVARWASSESGLVWLLPGDCAPWCGENPLSRNWTVHNFIVEFDDAGLVKSSRDIPTPELLLSLQKCVAQTNLQTAELQNPKEFGVTHHSVWSASTAAKLVLSPTSFGLQEPDKPKHNFMVPLTTIKKIASLDYGKAGQAPNVSLIKIDVEFKEKTPAGKHTTLLISPPDLLVLVRCLHAANGAPNAP